MFSNEMYERLKRRNLSLTEIAHIAGEEWDTLSPTEKLRYELLAFSAKERYKEELENYKQTNEYMEYSRYLTEFEAKQSNQQQGTSRQMFCPR